ncbi:MAG: NUDIX domain-containing protein [Candidatus Paracaedibacteraceae bacterium]|nr:NUDIX domain-containing protein [Candidatus Paracaedibacteraceae bacterium]
MKLYLHVIECAIEHHNKFLTIERPAGTYAAGLFSFPGGKVDLQDEVHSQDILRATVKREILEEVGLNLIDPIEYVFSSYFTAANDIPILNSTFYCKLRETNPTVTPSPREVASYAWLSPDEIYASSNCADWLKDYLTLILDYNACKV